MVFEDAEPVIGNASALAAASTAPTAKRCACAVSGLAVFLAPAVNPCSWTHPRDRLLHELGVPVRTLDALLT